MGAIVMVNASGVTIPGGGSWDSTTCPYTMPSELRPPVVIYTDGTSRDGALSTVLYVGSDGKVTIANAGGHGVANKERFASLTYVVG